MRAVAFAVLAALAATPRPGSAQWRARPMVVPAPDDAEVLLGRFSGPLAGDEVLLVDRATGAGSLLAHEDLLSAAGWPHALPASTTLRAARTQASNADPLADIAYRSGAPATSSVVIRFGIEPDTPVTRGGPAGLVTFAHLLPHEGETVVFTSPFVDLGSGFVEAWGLDTSIYGGTAISRRWRADGLAPLEAGEHELFGIRLSAAAAALGIEDLALPTNGGVFLLAHRPATPDLRYAAPPSDPLGLALVEVLVGGASAEARPPWLPVTIETKGDALGAAALDVTGDGVSDLVFTYGSTLDVPDGRGGFVPGRLVAVRGTGDPLDLAWPAGAWEDVTGRPDLQPLVDPVTLRQVAVGGAPAAAVWDRDLDEVVVFWPDPGGGLRTWRGEAAGRRVRDIRLADVVGSPAPDLVVVAEDVLVYPDAGDASPVLAWSPGSPGSPVRGEDLLLSVVAGDPDGDLTLEWFVGDPYGAPVATAVVPAGPSLTVDYLRSGALLCDPPPQTIAVTVRATDALGVYEELSATLDVAFPPPALGLAGSTEDRLLLPEGGTFAIFDGSFPGGCGSVSFTWGGTLFDAVPDFDEQGTAATTRRIVDLPEPAYVALLAGPDPTVTLLVEDGGVASPIASLLLELDARSLVELEHRSDLPAIAPGEVVLLRTVLRSRLQPGVDLPGVRVVDVLSGLEPAGPPIVTGATVAATSGADVVLASLPGGGAEVVVELPVRSTGGRGWSSVEVRSSGGHLLTPPAPREVGGATLPGCGCGLAGADPGWGLALLALAARRRTARRREGRSLT